MFQVRSSAKHGLMRFNFLKVFFLKRLPKIPVKRCQGIRCIICILHRVSIALIDPSIEAILEGLILCLNFLIKRSVELLRREHRLSLIDNAVSLTVCSLPWLVIELRICFADFIDRSCPCRKLVHVGLVDVVVALFVGANSDGVRLIVDGVKILSLCNVG